MEKQKRQLEEAERLGRQLSEMKQQKRQELEEQQKAAQLNTPAPPQPEPPIDPLKNLPKNLSDIMSGKTIPDTPPDIHPFDMREYSKRKFGKKPLPAMEAPPPLPPSLSSSMSSTSQPTPPGTKRHPPVPSDRPKISFSFANSKSITNATEMLSEDEAQTSSRRPYLPPSKIQSYPPPPPPLLRPSEYSAPPSDPREAQPPAEHPTYVAGREESHRPDPQHAMYEERGRWQGDYGRDGWNAPHHNADGRDGYQRQNQRDNSYNNRGRDRGPMPDRGRGFERRGYERRGRGGHGQQDRYRHDY